MLSLNSDNTVQLTDLKDNLTGQAVNDATVSGSLLDLGGHLLASFTMSYVGGSSGEYIGFIPVAIASTLSDGEAYLIRVVVESSGATQTFSQTDMATYPEG